VGYPSDLSCHEVVELGDFELQMAAHGIVPADNGGCFGNLEAQHVRVGFGLVILGFDAETVVFEGYAGLLGSGAQGVEPLRGTPTAIEGAGFEKFVGVRFVDIQAFGLQIGAILPALARAFVRRDAESFEAVVDLLYSIIDEAGAFGILDAQHEHTAGMTGPEPVK